MTSRANRGAKTVRTKCARGESGLVLVAGADASRWRSIQQTLGDHTVAFSIDAAGTADLIERERPSALVLCSDLLDVSATTFLSRLQSKTLPTVVLIEHDQRDRARGAGGEGERAAPNVHVLRDSEVETKLETLVCTSAGNEAQAPSPRIVELEAYRPLVVGESEAMRRVIDTVRSVATVDVNVLLHGETGTGKELVARRLHCQSNRARGPFRAVNLAAIPTGVSDSVLFGHERGAFTGAIAQRAGVFEQAQHGTLFLDEVSSADIALQPKLLRALQEREVERVGAQRAVSCDVRIVSATNIDLLEAVERREFRADLYHRLSVVVIDIPALRHRVEDIPALVDFMLKQYAQQFRCELPTVSSCAMSALQRYSWPGNIRELENRVQKALLLGAPVLEPQDFFNDNASRSTATQIKFGGAEYRLEQVEQAYIEEVLARTGGNQTQAAQLLGIDRKTLRAKRKRYVDPAKQATLAAVPLCADADRADDAAS